MKIITDEEVKKLNITPSTCVQWVTESFKLKYKCQLPAKMSVHPYDIDFFTTMPCLLPLEYDKFSVKVVSRIKNRIPALKSELLLYRSSDGELLSLLDADWITSMRTGAVATLAINTFKKNDSRIYSFLGLGNTAHSTMKCLESTLDKSNSLIRLLKYKNQAELFIKDFQYTGLKFEIVEKMEDLISDSDVIISCITETKELICPDDSLFKPGVLIVPVHTRGFQNCDLFFDKVFADDEDHVKGFKYFSQFRNFDEISNVLLNNSLGRVDLKERILSYNIGLGLHDAFFAAKIFDMCMFSDNL